MAYDPANPSTARAGSNPGDVDAVYRKVSLRLIPLLFFCYMLNYMDRANIGFAKLQMEASLGFSDAVYGLAAGIFFIGYALFEVPSNLLLRRIGARKTILRIMVLWGLTSAATMFVQTPTQFYIARFLLGVFEAGFFPGIVLYLTFWYPQERRARMVSWFMLASVVAAIVTGPLSGWIMKSMHGANGWEGWQWMFLLEGLPTVALGVVVYLTLADSPAQARWLDGGEKRLIARSLAGTQDHATAHEGLGTVLRDPVVYLLSAVGFLTVFGIYFLSFWLPTIFKDMGVTDVQQIGFYVLIPNLAAAIFMVWFSRRSDLRKERRGHFTFAALLGAAGFIGAASAVPANHVHGALLAFVVTGFGVLAMLPIFWAICTATLSRQAAPAGIALINTLANLAGMASPVLIGAIKTKTGSMAGGLVLSAALVSLAALLLLAGMRTGRMAIASGKTA